VAIFSQIQGAVNSILPSLYTDEDLTTSVTWKKFVGSVFNEEEGVNEDSYKDFTKINAIKIEREMGSRNAGRTFPPGPWAISSGDVQYLFQFADVPTDASIRDLVIDNETHITYNVKKIYPVFGLIVKVDVIGYA
jgi:hypothetical protein